MDNTFLNRYVSNLVETDNNKISVIDYLNRIEGFKTKCKNLHWSAYKMNMHLQLDSLLSILDAYQDSIAEDYMGINGKLSPNVLKGIESQALDPITLLNEIISVTSEFYTTLPQEVQYKGIISETETFIHNLNKFKYLFGLCDYNII